MTAAPFFLFAVPVLAAKKDPKKLCSSFLASTSRSLSLFRRARLALGSFAAGGGFAALSFSVTRAVA